MVFSGIEIQNNVITLCAFFILFVIAMKIVTSLKSCIEPTETELNENSVYAGQCKFPDCVRCRRQKEVLMRARTRLTYYDGNTHDEDVTSASAQLLKDIQASYQKLTQNANGQFPKTIDFSKPNPLNFHLKGVRAQPVWDVDNFPGLDVLSENVDEIESEFRYLLNNDAKGYNTDTGYWKVNETPTGKWGICHLLDQGVQTQAAAACPVTWKTVCSLSAAMTDTLFGNVAFSVIEPGTKIAPHFGPTNIRIRCHLGLQIPDGCQLTVGDQLLQWSRGSVMCFDETYVHGVQHSGSEISGEPRVVLLLDLWHPDIDKEQRELISYAFTSATLP